MWQRLCQMGDLKWSGNKVCLDQALPGGGYHPHDWSPALDLGSSFAAQEPGLGYGSMSTYLYFDRQGRQIVHQVVLNQPGMAGWQRECQISVENGEWSCPQTTDGKPTWQEFDLGRYLLEMGESAIGAFSEHIQPIEIGGRLRQTYVSGDGLRFYTRQCSMTPDGPDFSACEPWKKGEFYMHTNPRTWQEQQAVSAFSDFYYVIDDPANPQTQGLHLRQSFVSLDGQYGWTHACRVADLPPDQDAWAACYALGATAGSESISAWAYTIVNNEGLRASDNPSNVTPDILGYSCVIFHTIQPIFAVPTEY